MKNCTRRVTLTMIGLALTAIQSLAQSNYEPYTFTTLAGNAARGSTDGTSAARFARPSDVAVDSGGNVYVAEYGNNTIRKVTSAGVVTTLAGLAGEFNPGSADGVGSAARFNRPSGVAVDDAANVYVADTDNHTIRTGNVYVANGNTIRKGYPAPMILNSGFNGGQFGFNLTGPAGRPVIVEVSTDLVSWLPLWTNTFTFPAALNFTLSSLAVMNVD